uniref:Uncharacterized protein n=1 Tax=Anguilla anguilla TaxID=7936 RepID=A0A0E9W8P3_ANGAN
MTCFSEPLQVFFSPCFLHAHFKIECMTCSYISTLN